MNARAWRNTVDNVAGDEGTLAGTPFAWLLG